MINERRLSASNKIKWVTAPVRRLEETKRRLQRRRLLGLYPPFVPYTPEERTNPETVMQDAKSTLVIAVPYWHPSGEADQESWTNHNYPISRSAWGADYHQVVLDILQALLVEMIGPKAADRAHVQVDSGPLQERAFAQSLDLGILKANGCIYVEPFGSWVFLGIAVTDRPLIIEGNATWLESETNCYDCQKCIAACPTGALVAPYRINWYRCLSYLTQKRGFLPRALRRAIGGRLFGCDTCQLVCPDNRSDTQGLVAFAPDESDIRPELTDILKMNDSQFKKAYGNKSFAWRGRRTLQRNALIALGNTAGAECLQQIAACLSDRRPVIRGHAAWALGRIAERNCRSLGAKISRQISALACSDEDRQVRKEAEAVADILAT